MGSRQTGHVLFFLRFYFSDFRVNQATASKLLNSGVYLPRTLDSCYFGSMLDNFSMRARQIIFAARFKAGERGANMIDTDDFLVGLILEDQGMLEKTMFSTFFEGPGTFVNQAQLHAPFFSSKVVEDLLANLKTNLPQSRPVALTTEVALSPSLERVFDSAKALQTRFQHSQIEPLHLLAAILTEEASQRVKLLQESGITQEKVLLTLSRAFGN